MRSATLRPVDVRELSQLVRNTGRFSEVVSILAKYGFAGWLEGTGAGWARKLLRDSPVHELGQDSPEARVRKALIELGTTFVKLGQVLSTRPVAVSQSSLVIV